MAATCLGLSMWAHVAAGGTVHLSLSLLAGGLALSGMCVAAADSRRSFGGILSVVLLSQVGLHLFAGAGGGHHGEPADVSAGPAMFAYHVVAGILLSALLANGERLVWALWSLACLPRVPDLGEPVPATEPPAAVPTYRPAIRVRLDVGLVGPPMRAPPAGVTAQV